MARVPFDHRRNHMSQDPRHAGHVDLEHGVDLIRIPVLSCHRPVDPCQMDVAVDLPHVLGGTRHVVGIAHIDGDIGGRLTNTGRDFFQGILATGRNHDLCARLETELLSPGRASIVIVSLPERLVLSETLMLCETVEREIGLPVDRLVVNRVPAALPPDALSEAFRLSAKHGPTAEAAEKLASRIEVRSTVRNQVMDALRTTVDDHGDSTGGDRSLTLLPVAPSEPNAATVATWLREQGAA